MKRYIVLTLLWLIGFETTGQGVIFDDDVYRSAPVKPQLMRGDYQAPQSFSLKKYCPKLSNQLSYSTSVGWAIAWQARSILYNKNHNLTGEERNKFIFAPAYIYQKANQNNEGGCDEGITLESGLKVVKEYGVPLFNDYVYFCGGSISPELDEQAANYKISDYSKVFELADTKEKRIRLVKKTLSEGWPVVVGMQAPPSLRRSREFWQPSESPSEQHPGQALCVVGYDDNKYGGAFEVANSWGGDWGNDGFLWIRYKDFAEFVKYAYEVFSAQTENHYRLKGGVKFQLSSKDFMPVESVGEGRYVMKETYSSGTQFQIFVTNEDPAFVYVFGSDLTNECFQIFPHKKTVSAALTYKSSHIAIPDENHFIEFDDTPGTDFLCVLYSREELDIEGIIQTIESSSGSFYEKVKSSLGKQVLNTNINWADEDIAFDASTDNGSIVSLVVEVKHN